MAREPVENRNLRDAQLFIDDTWVEDSLGVGRVFHSPRKYPWPVLTAEGRWERYCPVTYGTVLFWRGRFRVWYTTWTRSSAGKVCYAESEDGVFWEKPALGLFQFDGATDNNIVYLLPDGGVDCLGVIDDPEDDEWPLKAILWRGVKGDSGLVALRSNDGVHWDETPGLVLPNWGDRTNIMPAKDLGRYVVFGRAPSPFNAKYGIRTVWRTESADLVRWTEPELVMKPDPEDPPRMQIYSMNAFRYEGLILGFIERMHMTPDKVDLELAYSFDGRQWHRTRPRPSFIPWGHQDAWDDTWVASPTNGVVKHKGRLWCYYSGRSGAHGASEPHNQGAIGLATLREDGFASMQAMDSTGWIETPAVVWPGDDLLLNMDARADITSHPRRCTGEVRVEVRDSRNKPLEGFAADVCVPLCLNTEGSNSHRPVAVKWQNGKTMAALRRRKLKLVFRMRDCHLYSFRSGKVG
jgi:hypothetical protein